MAASEVLSAVGMTVLGGFLDSYVPGLSSVLGLGGEDQGTQQILEAIGSSTVQPADRMRRLEDSVTSGQSSGIQAKLSCWRSTV